MAWTWALVGTAYVVVWLVAPIDLARPVSIALVAGCALAIIVQAVRLSSSRPRPAV